jgi:hypothetical protein
MDSEFRIGDRIYHDVYKRGTICRVRSAPKLALWVQFDAEREPILIAAFPPHDRLFIRLRGCDSFLSGCSRAADALEISRERAPTKVSHTRLRAPSALRLFYMCPLENVESILRHGILAHNEKLRRRLSGRSVALSTVQDLRRRVVLVDGATETNLHDYVPLYFCCRTPMLHRLIEIQDRIVYIEIQPRVLDLPGVILSDGNAANQGLSHSSVTVRVTVARRLEESSQRTYSLQFDPPNTPKSGFYSGPLARERLPWSVIADQWWANHEDGKRQKHAEALVPSRIDPSYFVRLYTRGYDLWREVSASLTRLGAPFQVWQQPSMYFDSPQISSETMAFGPMSRRSDDDRDDLDDLPF